MQCTLINSEYQEEPQSQISIWHQDKDQSFYKTAGADPGFLGRGFICINLLGVCFADDISFFLNIPWK